MSKSLPSLLGSRAINFPRRSISSPGRLSQSGDDIDIRDSHASSNSGPRFRRSQINDLPFGDGLTIPGTYRVPTSLLQEIFISLDQRDSPKKPGKILFSTAQSALTNFMKAFGEPYNDDALKARSDAVIEDLQKQVDRKKHNYLITEEAMVYWDQDIIFTCFSVDLSGAERLFFTFDVSENSTWASRGVSYVIMSAIIVSVVTFVAATVDDLPKDISRAIPLIDIVCVCIFSLDYLVRLCTVPIARMELLNRGFLEDLLSGRRVQPLSTKCQRLRSFLFSPMGVVDLLSIAPFWVELCLEGISGLGSDSRSEVLRVLRLIQVVRVFKLGKAANVDLGEDRNMVLHLFLEVVDKGSIALQLVFLLILLALLVFGSLVWFCERGEHFDVNDPRCPEASLCAESSIRIRRFPDGSYEGSASPFTSIPAAFWWVLVTISTVGYGDYYPVTSLGYVVGGVCILYGTMVLTLPVGIIGTAFSTAYDKLLAAQAIRRKCKETETEGIRVSADDKAEGADELSRLADISGEPEVVAGFKTALNQACLASGVMSPMCKKWEAEFSEVVKFQRLLREAPCDTLEAWGVSVFAVLREHTAVSEHRASKCLSRLRETWYTLLLQTLQAHTQYQAIMPPDRRIFEAALRAKDIKSKDTEGISKTARRSVTSVST